MRRAAGACDERERRTPDPSPSFGNPTTASPWATRSPAWNFRFGAPAQPDQRPRGAHGRTGGVDSQAVVIRDGPEHAQSDQDTVTLRARWASCRMRVTVTRKDRSFVVTTPGHD